ncbi:MAG: hypothetical protein IT287_04575 [Bdellovibrionaceae bacterium]|nr:hypothetical protein [Pseudobdellovibrionaceae bacterium]
MVFVSALLSLLFVCSASAQIKAEQGLALTDSAHLAEIEASGFSLSNIILQSAAANEMDNEKLSDVAVLKPVITNLKAELAALAVKKKEINFDQNFLNSPKARFILVGIINRIDRGYHSESLCGEIRFIYRLEYDLIDNGKAVRSRLPITLNVIFRGGLSEASSHCSEFAKSWLKMNASSSVADWTKVGPLSANFFSYTRLQSLEFNVQAVREGSENSENFGGRAQYLLKVYDWNGNKFEESTLENQIDRAALIKNPKLLKELKSWILDPANLTSLDEGTIVLPKKFLAKRAVSIAPGGLARSQNRPYYDLFKSEDFKDLPFQQWEQIKSKNGLIRRLNDTTCTGCHQTRAVGGFHFSGLDPSGKYPGNSVFLPGSPHFMGDLPRRLSIVKAVANGEVSVDYSRGFAARPQARRSQVLRGTGLLNGWSAPCSNGKDPSFKDWTCANGFVCKNLLDVQDDSEIGMCLNETQKIGDPCEFGKTKTTSYGVDKFERTGNRKIVDLDPKKTMCSPQSQDKGTKTGGFLNGNIRTLSCQDGPGEGGLPPEANCGPLPAAKPGFNACIGKKNFDDCLREFSMGVGLRGCDDKNPCRDDYICAEGFTPERGICAPPYFLFQFRVDGHPKGDIR